MHSPAICCSCVARADRFLETIYNRETFYRMERRIPIGFALLATKCSSILIPLERLDSKDNHRPAQCRQPDRSLNSSDTIVTRWMRADKRSCIAGQIIVAAAISLRNLVPAHVGRQASNADKAWEPRTFHPCVFIYIYAFSNQFLL